MFEFWLTWIIVLLLINLISLSIVWNRYGSRINVLIDRKEEKDLIFGKNFEIIYLSFFMTYLFVSIIFFKIERLRKEALELKLPKEHTPRI